MNKRTSAGVPVLPISISVHSLSQVPPTSEIPERKGEGEGDRKSVLTCACKTPMLFHASMYVYDMSACNGMSVPRCIHAAMDVQGVAVSG